MMARNPTINRHIQLAFWNADGVWEQRQELRYFLKELNIDILLLNENHLKHYHHSKLHNYTIIRSEWPGGRDWKEGLQSGVTYLYSKSPYRLFNPLKLQDFDYSLQISVYLNNNIQVIWASTNATDIQQLSCLGNIIIIAGDINAKHPHWNSTINNNADKAFYRALPNLDTTPIETTEPTHFPKNCGGGDLISSILH